MSTVCSQPQCITVSAHCNLLAELSRAAASLHQMSLALYSFFLSGRCVLPAQCFTCCRLKHEALLRYTEVGWQVWNMWAIRLLESYRDEGFHPLGANSNDEWEAEEQRILNIEQAEVRQAQLDNLAEVKRVRDSELKDFDKLPHVYGVAIHELMLTVKSYGVSAINPFSTDCSQQTVLDRLFTTDPLSTDCLQQTPSRQTVHNRPVVDRLFTTDPFSTDCSQKTHCRQTVHNKPLLDRLFTTNPFSSDCSHLYGTALFCCPSHT